MDDMTLGVLGGIGINLASGILGWIAGHLVTRYWNPVRFTFSPHNETTWEVTRMSGPKAIDVFAEGASFNPTVGRRSNRNGVQQWDLKKGQSISVFPIVIPGVYRLHGIERNKRRYFDVVTRAGVFDTTEIRRRDAKLLKDKTITVNMREGRFAKG